MRVINILRTGALIALLGSSAAAQDRTVTGRVTTFEGNTPVARASVWLRGSAISVVTDAQGAYRIVIPAASSDVLVFSHASYDVLELPLHGQSSADAVLRTRVRINQYGQPVTRTPLTPEVRDGSLVFESADERYRLWFDIRVQLDGAVFDGARFNKLGNGVAMRRGRLGLKANLTENWYAEWDVDFSGASAEVKDMYLQYQNGALRAKIGNFKENLSLERNTSSRYLTFMERPVSTNSLTPDRNLGLQFSYRVPSVIAFLGVHFQDMEDAELVTAREDNNNSFGQSEGYSLTGKLVGNLLNDGKTGGLHAGVAGSYRTPKTDDVLNTVRFDTRSQSNINRKKFLDTDRITDVDHYTIAAFEVAAFRRNLRAQAEYYQNEVTRTGELPSATFSGAYASASAMLFGGEYRYDAEDGEFTQPSRGRTWGDVELAARYDYLDLTSGAITGGEGEIATLGVNYHINHNVKVMLNASWLNHDRYANGRNRLFVGHDETGALTTNPALVVEGKGQGGEKFRMFAIRFEVDF